MTCPVQIKDLSFSFPGMSEKLFKGINLHIKKGETLLIRGSNGSGKTTLCYVICGIIPLIRGGIINGEVRIKGISTKETKIHEISKHTGIVLQNPDTQLFLPTVEDEIAFGPENFALPRKEIKERVDMCLDLLGIEKLRYLHPKDLSGGEKQLVAIASVLSLNPEIFILDEITSHLDTMGKALVKKLLLKLRSEGKTIIMVDHSKEFFHIADRIRVLDKGCLNDWAN